MGFLLLLCACFSVYSIMHMPYILTSPINETASKKVIPANVRVITLDDKGGYSCVNRRVNTRILT